MGSVDVPSGHRTNITSEQLWANLIVNASDMLITNRKEKRLSHRIRRLQGIKIRYDKVVLDLSRYS